MTRKLLNRSGFTLVEILIVVIILGVLAAVAIPQFTSSTDDAKTSALDMTLSELRNAIELYFHQHGGTYPGQLKLTTVDSEVDRYEAAHGDGTMGVVRFPG